MPVKRYIFFAVALACALALLLISVLLVHHYIKKPSDTIIVRNIVLSDEIENESRLTGTVSRFSYGTRQIFVFFDFEKAQIGTDIAVNWYYGGKKVLADVRRLEETSGHRAYGLSKEDGSLLPKGAYSLRIMQGDKTVIPEYVFNIF
ncbi:MAG: hypothetical protein FWG09_06695 [Synergistaceae bacterium]|nr:hypothetical protein [Synergistaceae bacterium]